MIDNILNDRKKYKEEDIYDVEEFYSHEKYNNYVNPNDISSFENNGQEKLPYLLNLNLNKTSSFDSNYNNEKNSFFSNLSQKQSFDSNENKKLHGSLSMDDDIQSFDNNENEKFDCPMNLSEMKSVHNIAVMDNKIKEEKKKSKNQTSNTNYGSTKPTATKLQKIVVKIFRIEKVNKKVGRLSKKIKIKFNKIKHDKFSQDNIIRKIKVNFHDRLLNYINKLYGKYYRKKHRVKKMIKLLQKITPSESTKIRRDENLGWFSLKVKDVLSRDLSLKCSKYGLDYNKRQIDDLYKKGEAKIIITILDTTIRDVYHNYCNDEEVEDFETLKEDISEMKKKMVDNGEKNIEEYLNNYKKIAQNLEQIFMSKKSRKAKVNTNS